MNPTLVHTGQNADDDIVLLAVVLVAAETPTRNQLKRKGSLLPFGRDLGCLTEKILPVRMCTP